MLHWDEVQEYIKLENLMKRNRTAVLNGGTIMSFEDMYGRTMEVPLIIELKGGYELVNEYRKTHLIQSAKQDKALKKLESSTPVVDVKVENPVVEKEMTMEEKNKPTVKKASKKGHKSYDELMTEVKELRAYKASVKVDKLDVIKNCIKDAEGTKANLNNLGTVKSMIERLENFDLEILELAEAIELAKCELKKSYNEFVKSLLME